jgi:hypothetical protein
MIKRKYFTVVNVGDESYFIAVADVGGVGFGDGLDLKGVS